MNQLGIRKNDDSLHHLKQSKIKKDNEALHNVISVIQDTMNSFDEIEKDHLYNIATGKAASTETEDFLLNIQGKGEKARKKFIDDCIENPKRFEDRICRQALATFAIEAGKRRVRSNGKEIAACFMRDLFGSLLHISLEKKVDINVTL